MSFSDIEGHHKPVRIIQQALANKTLAHAYLFSGDAGIGKKLTALALAAAVNCPDAGPGGGCGVCPSCKRISSRTHPDIHMVMSESEDEQLLSTWTSKEVEKASSEIKIDQIRELQDGMSLTPSEGGKKVLIVDGAEAMNVAAQNAFLKTLEEPPGESLIIMVSSRPQSLLPTIRSRCQEIRFQPLPRKTLAQALMQRRGLTEEDAWFLAALAQGSIGRGLAMDVEQEKTARAVVMALWNGLAPMNAGEVLVQAEALSKDRDRFDRMLMIGVEWLRDALVYHETGDETLLVNGQQKDQHREWGAHYPVRRMLADLDLFFASRALLDRRVSAQLVAENLLLKLGKA